MVIRGNIDKQEVATRLDSVIELLGTRMTARLLGANERALSYWRKQERTINPSALQLLGEVEIDAQPLLKRLAAVKKLEGLDS